MSLPDFIRAQKDEIVLRARARAHERSPRPTESELREGIPLFVDQLVGKLEAASSPNEAVMDSAATLGGEMSRQGFTIKQVVQGYGDVCQVVTGLAIERGAAISNVEFKALNKCLDTATAEAVAGYEAQREATRSRRGAERLGFLTHELRNHLYVAMLSYDLLKRGDLAIHGSTGAVLGRSLGSLRTLIDRSLAEVRLEGGVRNEERVSVRDFLEEVEVVAAFEANARGLRLSVGALDEPAEVLVDRQILASALGNLVQNACKFTVPNGHISISPSVVDGQVLLAVTDQCGGLPPGKADELFAPFEQRGVDRTGLGLGLTIARRAVEACHGQLRVDDVPGEGCRFTIALPLAPTLATNAGGPP